MNDLSDVAKKHLDHKMLRKNLRERIEQSLVVPFNGGLFKVSKELIIFSGIYDWDSEYIFIEDEYGNPIKFTRDERVQFNEKLQKRYNEVMNEWHEEFNRLKQIRKADQL